MLAALTGTDVFACGVSLFGVAELTEFVQDTHDFESRYIDGLVGPLPEAARRSTRTRAPLNHVDGLSCPVLLLQGLDDPIVPPSQAELFRDALVRKGIPHAYRPYEGESHGFRKRETMIDVVRVVAVVLRAGVRVRAARRPAPRTCGAEASPDVVEEGWAQALAPVAGQISAMGDFLRAEVAAGRTYLPAGKNILRAFTQPFADVRVLIVGQDPYPTPGHAVGLSFSVEPDVRPVPRSLQNIYKELNSDLGLPTPSNGDLTPWSRARRAAAEQVPDRRAEESRRRIAARAGRR